MDNLFDILIFLFIIFSILAPLFKKKDPQKQQQRSGENPERKLEYQKSNYRTEEEDQKKREIIVEIEKMFEPDRKSEDNFNSDFDYDKEFGLTKAKKPKETLISSLSKKDKSKIKSIEEEAKKFELLLEEKGKKEEINSYIKETVRNPKNLKDFIIYSEILGKPKALTE